MSPTNLGQMWLSSDRSVQVTVAGILWYFGSTTLHALCFLFYPPEDLAEVRPWVIKSMRFASRALFVASIGAVALSLYTAYLFGLDTLHRAKQHNHYDAWAEFWGVCALVNLISAFIVRAAVAIWDRAGKRLGRSVWEKPAIPNDAIIASKPRPIYLRESPTYGGIGSNIPEPIPRTKIQGDLHNNTAHLRDIWTPDLQPSAEHALRNAEVAALKQGNEQAKQAETRARTATTLAEIEAERLIAEEKAKLAQALSNQHLAEAEEAVLNLRKNKVLEDPAKFNHLPSSSISRQLQAGESNLGGGGVPPAGGRYLTGEELRGRIQDLEAAHGRSIAGWMQGQAQLCAEFPSQAVEISGAVNAHLRNAGLL